MRGAAALLSLVALGASLMSAGAAAAIVPAPAPAASPEPGSVIGCVFPSTKTGHGKRLVIVHPIVLRAAPDKKAAEVGRLTALVSLAVVGEENGFDQLRATSASAPDYKDGQVLGWADENDLDDQALRNCNLEP
jgi:hypothetical protein